MIEMQKPAALEDELERVVVDRNQDSLPPTTVGTYKRFLACGAAGMRALQVYQHLLFTYRLQRTDRVWATTEYLMLGLHMGNNYVRSARALLAKMGMIEVVRERGAAGRLGKGYIRLVLLPNPGPASTTSIPDMPQATTSIQGMPQATRGILDHPVVREDKCLKKKVKCLKKERMSSRSAPTLGVEERPGRKQTQGYKEFVAELHRLHLEATGSKFVFQAKDGANVKRILASLGPDEAVARLRRYYTMDFWFTKDGRSFGGFIAHLNELTAGDRPRITAFFESRAVNR